MSSKKYLVYAIAAAVLLCWVSAYQFGKDKTSNRSKEATAALETILKSQPESPARSQLPMNGAISTSPIAEMNDTYLRLHLSDVHREIPSEALIKLGQCLRSGQLELRYHCQTISLDMLTAWVFNRPESEWHRNPEIDAFFKIFKSTHYSRLESFFARRAVNYEQKYLSQI